MSALASKMRKARQVKVEAGGFAFLCRRPTVAESGRIASGGIDAMLDLVVGWEGVKEIDLIPGGNAIEVPFDADDCKEFLADRPDLWGPISEAIMAAYNAHAKRLEEVAKN